MTSLKSQRRIAAQILKVGGNRVWIDPDRADDVEAAITREDIKRLIHEGSIKSRPEQGISRGRAKALHAKRKKGLRRGVGSHTGSPRAVISKKDAWMAKIRALRNRLRLLKTKKLITKTTYRDLYEMASSGRFESVADLQRYMESRGLWRKR